MDSGVAAGPDLDPGEAVAGDVVVLQRPATLIVDQDAGMLAVVDAVATESRVGPPVDRNTREALACDIASLQLKAALGDVHAIPLPAPDLAQRQIRHTAQRRLKQEGVL